MAAFVQPLQQKIKLILAAPPFLLQIHQQRNHRVPSRVSRSAAISFPSFWYFKRTERAAICAIRAPRCPSRNPPRTTKFCTKVHGVANHRAPRQCRRPAENICSAASVEYLTTLDSCSEKSRTV